MDEFESRYGRLRTRLARQSPRDFDQTIRLGVRDGQPIDLPISELDNSIHIMGATREGKSKQLENLFRQFLLSGIGGAVIDPHGYLYDDLLAFCSEQSLRHPEIADRVVLFDPGDSDYIVGLDALQEIPGHDLETLCLSRMYATLKSRGKDTFDDFPTAKVWLQNIYTPLIKKGLTLIEARHLIDRGAKNSEVAKNIVQGTGIDLIEHDWEFYHDSSKKIQYEELLSSINMLRNFVTSPRMELIFGRKDRVLDLRAIMDEGKVLLVNLGSRRLHTDLARLLGTLLVNEFFLTARTREEGARPFYLAIDEFENYVTQDIADILDQGHKFGLRLILAHHSLEQLRDQNQRVYAAVMQNAKIKIMYGGLTYENAEILAKELFSYFGPDGIDPMRVKHTQEAPYLEPKESTRIVKAQGAAEAESSGSSSGDSSGWGDMSGYVMHSGTTTIPVDSLFMSDQIQSYINSDASQFSSGRHSSTSSASHDSHSKVKSYSEALIPFVEQQLKWYESSIQFFSVEEQVYAAAARLKNLPQQVCMVKLPKQPVMTVLSNTVKPVSRNEGELPRVAGYLNSRSPYHMPAAEARKAREAVLSMLKETAEPASLEILEDDERWQ